MATQYIEDPETKEKIPFEWNKSSPPTSDDINSLFQSVKSSRFPTNRTMKDIAPVEGEISQAPPKWAGYARTGLEMLGLIGAAGPGYAAAKEVGNLLPGSPPTLPPPAQGTAEPINKQLADWKIMGLSKSDAEKALKRPIPDEEWNMSNPPSLFPPESLPGKIFGKAGEVSRNIAEGQAMEIGGQAAGKLIPRILPMYARGRTAPAAEVASIAKREGIRIPATDITESTGQSAITSSLQKLPQSSKTMQEEAINATGQFSNYVDRTLGKLGGKKEPFLAGQSAKEGRLIKMEDTLKQGTQLYDEAKIAAKDAPITFDKVASAIDKVQGSDRYKLLSEAGKKEVDTFTNLIKSRTIPKTGEIGVPTGGGATVPMQVSKGGGKGFIDQAALEGVAKEGNVITNFLDAEGFRKSLAEKVYSRGAKKMEGFGPMKDIYKAFEDDMATSSKSAGNKAYTAFKDARDFWAKNVVEEGKGIVSKLGTTGPSRSISLLKNAPIEDLQTLKAGIPADNFTTFRQGLFTQILQDVSQTSPVTGETIYNGPQLAKALFGRHGIGEVRLKIFTTPEEFKFLKDMATVGERMGSSWRIAGNPSGTAHTLYVLHLLGQAGATAGAAVAGEQLGGRKTAAAAAIGSFLAPYAVAKLITSNIGRRYLISGFPAAERAVSRVLPAGIVATRGVLGGKEPEKLALPPKPPKKENE